MYSHSLLLRVTRSLTLPSPPLVGLSPGVAVVVVGWPAPCATMQGDDPRRDSLRPMRGATLPGGGTTLDGWHDPCCVDAQRAERERPAGCSASLRARSPAGRAREGSGAPVAGMGVRHRNVGGQQANATPWWLLAWGSVRPYAVREVGGRWGWRTRQGVWRRGWSGSAGQHGGGGGAGSTGYPLQLNGGGWHVQRTAFAWGVG